MAGKEVRNYNYGPAKPPVLSRTPYTDPVMPPPVSVPPPPPPPPQAPSPAPPPPPAPSPAPPPPPAPKSQPQQLPPPVPPTMAPPPTGSGPLGAPGPAPPSQMPLQAIGAMLHDPHEGEGDHRMTELDMGLTDRALPASSRALQQLAAQRGRIY